jgi:hypothetical protein
LRGAEAVLALVLIEWAAGWAAIAAWSQSWNVVKRGHFRISAWAIAGVAAMAVAANAAAVDGLSDRGVQPAFVIALAALAAVYAAAQYVRGDIVGVVTGSIAGVAGIVALSLSARHIEGWSDLVAAAGLIAGALLLGGVTNGMMLGHWYLNQPGLKIWALGRLADLCLVAVGLSAVAGVISYGELTGATTEGAVLGIPGFGESFSFVFFFVWLSMLALTGAVAWGARRCVQIRSIQSATGLMYVAILSAGVAEFMVRYLMVNAA